MRFRKLLYLSIYKFSLKLLLLIASGILLINCHHTNFVQTQSVQNQNLTLENAININTATAEELEKLPHVGEETAKNIIAFREKYGKFRRVENLILVHGMSDKKFRDLRNSVKVE